MTIKGWIVLDENGNPLDGGFGKTKKAAIECAWFSLYRVSSEGEAHKFFKSCGFRVVQIEVVL